MVLPKKLHFVGIGGAGMFPLVQILHSEGHIITGSDNSTSTNTDFEIAMGIPVQFGHDAKNVGDAELLIYTNAVNDDNPELAYAKKINLPIIERAELLAIVADLYKHSVSFCGAHGKTTTTAISTQILWDTGFDPSAAIGGTVPSLGGNCRIGKGSVFVCEACEFMDSFLHLNSSIGAILNIDNDHLDYFGSMENLILSFNKFAKNCKDYLIVNGDDKNCLKAAEGATAKLVTFGMSDNSDYYPANIEWSDVSHVSFDIMHKGDKLLSTKLSMPGNHNILNAIAGAIPAILLGADPQDVAKGIENFRGVGRRFEIIEKINGITVADDFAHHPTEIKATIEAVEKLNFNNSYIIFQPHTFSRTKMLFDEFLEVLAKVDKLLITDIYAAREVNTHNIYSKDITDKLSNSVLTMEFSDVCNYIKENAKDGDLVMTMGGGDIYKAADLIINMLKNGTK